MSLSSIRSKVSEAPTHDDNHGLMCTAHGCPLRWSVGPARLCSYHAWEPADTWPSITQSLQMRGPWELDPKKPVSTENYAGNPKAWALRLRDRHAAGEHLNQTVIAMYRSALPLSEHVS